MEATLTLAFLGLVQGLTEFLPISSSGHLILVREFFGIEGAFGLAEDAVLHLATAFAVVAYFRMDVAKLIHGGYEALRTRVWNREATLIAALAIGTLPAVFFGLLFEHTIETILRGSAVVAFGLILGSFVFLYAEYRASRNCEARPITVWRGFVVGLFQAAALIPGMSRSGMSISGGMMLGLSRMEAARFAFLLSFPVILGAGGLKLVELIVSGGGAVNGAALLSGALVAFLSGMAAIHFLISFLQTNTLIPFVVYRFALAGVILFTLI